VILGSVLVAVVLAAGDPVANELARWQEFVRTNPATDDDWKGTKAAVAPALAQAE
jgi:hypothetical protein